MNMQIIEQFMTTIARLYGLSAQHGKAMTLMLTDAHIVRNKLFMYTPSWRIRINEEFGWKTEKPSTRILRDLEKAGFITRSDRFSYLLDEDIFGNDYWYFISELHLTIGYGEEGRMITIHREYEHWEDEDMEEYCDE